MITKTKLHYKKKGLTVAFKLVKMDDHKYKLITGSIVGKLFPNHNRILPQLYKTYLDIILKKPTRLSHLQVTAIIWITYLS